MRCFVISREVSLCNHPKNLNRITLIASNVLLTLYILFYNISRTTLIKWIRTENIPTIDVGRAKRVRKDVFDDVLRLKRNVEEDT